MSRWRPEAVKDLELTTNAVDIFKYPTSFYLEPRVFRNDKVNWLTQCIGQNIEFCWGIISSISNQETYSRKHGKHMPSSSKRSSPDIICTYKGLSLIIEVKEWNGSLKPDQEKLKAEHEQSSVILFVAMTFTKFKEWIDAFKACEGGLKWN